MYNRYIPGTNGVYERRTVPDSMQAKSESCVHPQTEPECSIPCNREATQKCQGLLRGMDLGDLLLICIILLLLVDAEEEDIIPLLIVAAVFLFN